MGALLLALVAAIALFVAEPDRAQAQTAAGLSSLTVGGKQIALTVDGTATYDHTSNIIRVSSGTGSIAVSATPQTSTYKVEIRYGHTAVTGAVDATFPTDGTVATGSVPLVAGANTDIAVSVKPADDTVTTGTVHVVRVRRVPTGVGSNADLSGLTLTTPDTDLVPGFKPATTSYTAFVPYDVADNGGAVDDTIVVTPTLADTTTGDDIATHEVTSNRGSDKVSSAANVHTVTLEEGANVITIMVKAANVSTTKTYTVTVTRAAANASDDAKLSSLTVGGTSVKVPDPIANPSAAVSGDVGYATRVPNATSSITINAAKNHSGAVVVLKSDTDLATNADVTAWDNDDVDGQTVTLHEGLNYIAVQVTAEDGTSGNRKYYLIEVTRASSSFSDDADLVSLAVAGGADIPAGGNIVLVPPVKGATNYMVFVPYNVDNSNAETGNQVMVTATGFSNDEVGANALDKANVRVSADKIAADTTATTSNVATHLVTLGTGNTVVTITVESADATKTKTYTLTVRRAALNGLDDARLSALMVGSTSVNLKAFSPLDRAGTGGTHAVAYMARVPNTTKSIQITPTTMDSGAVAIIKTGDDAAASVAAAATVHPDGNVALVEGATTTIAVQVTAANGTTELNYIVSVERVLQGASDDAELSGLAVAAEASDGTASTATTFGLSPGFAKSTMEYMASVPNDVDGGETGADNNDTIVVTTTRADADAMVTVTSDNDDLVTSDAAGNAHTVELVEGANVITIMVQAGDAMTTKAYTLTVMRAAATASDDAGLSELTVHATGDATMVYRTVADPSASTTTATTLYETGVPNAVYNVQIAATLSDDNASMVIKPISPANPASITQAEFDGGTADADGVVDVIVGATNYFNVEVTAENGVAKAYYILKVNRARASADDGVKLSVLTTSEDPLTPAFDVNDLKMAYTAEVESGVDEITITATGGAAADTTTGSEQGAAIVRIMSNRDDAEAYGLNTVTDHTVDLMPGANVITIMVTAADYETMETYTITVTAPSQEPRDEAALRAMYDTNGTDGIQIDEAVRAVNDYADGILTIEEVVIVVGLYSTGE